MFQEKGKQLYQADYSIEKCHTHKTHFLKKIYVGAI